MRRHRSCPAILAFVLSLTFTAHATAQGVYPEEQFGRLVQLILDARTSAGSTK